MSVWLPFDSALNTAREVDIFAFTHAGASAQVFRNLISKMPSWIAFRPIELPGRGMRMSEGYEWDIREVADDLSNELPGFIEKPSIFFGHSMGALVAFETARLMSPSVLHLVVSGHRAPQVPRGHLRGHDQDDAVFVESLKVGDPIMLHGLKTMIYAHCFFRYFVQTLLPF